MTISALRKVMELVVKVLTALQLALHVGLHVWGLMLDDAVICRSGRKRMAEIARVFTMLMMIMITSCVKMWDVVAHLAHVDAAVGVRDRCFARGLIEDAPVVLDEPSDPENGRRVRQHEHSRSCAKRTNVNVANVRRLMMPLAGANRIACAFCSITPRSLLPRLDGITSRLQKPVSRIHTGTPDVGDSRTAAAAAEICYRAPARPAGRLTVLAASVSAGALHEGLHLRNYRRSLVQESALGALRATSRRVVEVPASASRCV